MSNKSKVLEMRQKRADIWNRAKAFLNERSDENGMMSAEDTQEYERMEQEVVDMAAVIDRLERADQMDREMDSLVTQPLTGKPQRQDPDARGGTRSESYKKNFWDHMHGRSGYDVRNALQVGELSEGGYTVPDEFEYTLIEALEDENIMRGVVHVITTASGDRKIPMVISKGAASWIEEEQQIPESDDTFGQISLSAHKVGCMIKISSELLHDSAFDMAAYIAREFGRRVGAAEEDAILNGDGNHKPTGLLHDTLGAQVGVTSAAPAAFTADEIIDLQHSIKAGYRRKAVFIMNDATIQKLRKLKDCTGNVRL